jgi:hypothetical protein
MLADDTEIPWISAFRAPAGGRNRYHEAALAIAWSFPVT